MLHMLNLSGRNSLRAIVILCFLLLTAFSALVLAICQIAGFIELPLMFYGVAILAIFLGSASAFIIYQGQSHSRSRVKQDNPGLHDELTHLPNYALFFERLEHDLAMARRHQKVMALVKLDIDKLSEINHRYGYRDGDKFIHEVATRLNDLKRESDTLARLGGGEFGLLLNLIEHEDEVDRSIQRLMKGMQEPFAIQDENIILKISYGICVYPRDGDDVEELMNHASLAMKHIKKKGGNGYHYFNREMNIENSRRLSEEYDLRQAMDNNEFCLHFQPKVDAATGVIKGMEALIRWNHPRRGLVSPLEFIPLLEESGMIVEAGEWVLRESCKLNKAWQDMGLEPLRVSVNVSSIQFKQENFIERIASVLKESGLDAKFLEIELTESCLMEDVTRNIDILHEIKKMNVAISIDDFGTGYSSLSYLKRFPIDTLKIDRSFIHNVQNRRENDNAAIVTAIMALSHSLRLDVVAEGVETAQELSYLHALGCKTIQGFLFSKPLSSDEFTKIQQDSLHMKAILEQVREELAR